MDNVLDLVLGSMFEILLRYALILTKFTYFVDSHSYQLTVDCHLKADHPCSNKNLELFPIRTLQISWRHMKTLHETAWFNN